MFQKNDVSSGETFPQGLKPHSDKTVIAALKCSTPSGESRAGWGPGAAPLKITASLEFFRNF